MVVKKKSRKIILKKKDKKLDTIGYSKLDIMWFFQWLKLAVDMEGQTIEFEKKVKKFSTKHSGQSIKKEGAITTWIPQITKEKIKFNNSIFNKLNINELKRLPKIMNMTKSEIFRHFNVWFVKNKYLFGDYAVHYAETNRDMIDNNDYITVQIPRSLDRRRIDNQIDVLMKGLDLKSSGGNKRDITFIRGVQKDVMQKQWDIFRWRHIDKKSSGYIAKNKKSLNYKSGETLQIKGGAKQTQGVRAVQKSYASAKCIIFNVSKGIFPKSTLD